MAERPKHVDRRTVIKTGTPLVVAGLAGCTGNGNDGNGNGDGSGNGNGNGDGGDATPTEQQSFNWRLGTSGQETGTHAAGVAFSSIVSENSDFVQMSAQTTEGTNANPRLIDEGQIDIGQSQTQATAAANMGREPFADPPIEKTLCQTYAFFTVNQFLVKRNIDRLSDIESMADIPTDGSVSISFGPRGASAWNVQMAAAAIAGVDDPTEAYDMQVMDIGDQASAMRNGRLDIGTVYTINNSILIGWIQELKSSTDLSVVRYPFDEQAVADHGSPILYSEQSADVWDQEVGHDSYPTLSLGYTTVIPADIPAAPVYELTKILMENKEQVREAHGVLGEFGPEFGIEFLLKNGEVPVHPGSEQYYREIDMWSDDLTSLEDFEA